MANYYNEIEATIAERIIAFLKGKFDNGLYELLYQPLLNNLNPQIAKRFRPDFVIMKGSYVYIIIEVVNTKRMSFNQAYKNVLHYKIFADSMEADYFIVTDGHMIRGLTSSGQEIEGPFQSLLDLINEDLRNVQKDRISEQILLTLKNVESESNGSDEKSIEVPAAITSLFLDLKASDISYNHEGRFFHFTDDLNGGMDGIENNFFNTF